MTISSENIIRYKSLLVALEALDNAGEDVVLSACEHGHVHIDGASGQINFDSLEGAWVFDGIDGTVLYA